MSERNEKIVKPREPRPKAVDPLKPHPELSKIISHEDPTLPLTEDEWPAEFR
jgi:hypothetical protein